MTPPTKTVAMWYSSCGNQDIPKTTNYISSKGTLSHSSPFLSHLCHFLKHNFFQSLSFSLSHSPPLFLSLRILTLSTSFFLSLSPLSLSLSTSLPSPFFLSLSPSLFPLLSLSLSSPPSLPPSFFLSLPYSLPPSSISRVKKKHQFFLTCPVPSIHI